MSENFCMSCCALLPPGCTACPACHEMVDQASGGANRELLIKVLHDTRAEVRSHAIFALGRRRDKFAADALVACALRHPADVAEGLQIVKVLAVIDEDGPRTTALQYLIARHPSCTVKQAAFRVINPDLSVAATQSSPPSKRWTAPASE